MVNRNIQIKIQKMRKRRASRPKSFSTANTGPDKHAGFLTEVIADDGTVSRSLQPLAIAARSRVASQLPNWSTMDRWIINTFKPDSPEAIYARTSGLHTDIRVVQGDALVLAKMAQSKTGAGSVQGENTYVKSVLIQRLNHERRIYISGDSVFFCEEIVTKTHRVYRISHEYDSAVHAMEDHKRDRILWEKTERMPLPKAEHR